MPTPSKASPIGVTLKSPKGSWPSLTNRSLRMMRGPEATMVRVPPRMAAKPMGMSSLEGGRCRAPGDAHHRGQEEGRGADILHEGRDHADPSRDHAQ